jgi:sigma-B regulation protein RsbU (phosphoserine phosphatase)
MPNIQDYLVPRRPASRFGAIDIAHAWQPLDEIGGDFLHYERVDEHLLYLEIGDVIGHGAHAGLVMTALHGLLFGLRQQHSPVDRMASSANDFLCRLQSAGATREKPVTQTLLCSMFIMRIDFRTATATYCNAGHPPAMYALHSSEPTIMALQTGGTILGALPTARYAHATLRPARGDTVLLFTDGLSEASNPSGEELGRAAIEELLRKVRLLPPREIVPPICNLAVEFRAGGTASDDLSIAVLQFNNNWLV